MFLLRIFILTLLAIPIGFLRKGRGTALLTVSALAVYWLQPAGGSDLLTFWIPFGTLVLTVTAWFLTATEEMRSLRRMLSPLAVLTLVSLLVGSARYLKFGGLFSITTPPLLLVVGIWLALLAGMIALAYLLRRRQTTRVLLILFSAGVILLLVILKAPVLTLWVYNGINLIAGRQVNSTPFSIQWLGFSYLVFRLLHTIFDRLSGRLPAVSLDEYLNYALFFPALAAGPIDRIERFLGDLRDPHRLQEQDWLAAGERLFLGVFKKFVLADALALISINYFAPFIHNAGWAWLVLYAYSFRLLFDFSGYTDIAIGMGRLMGIRLPENFATPYLKPNITQFWNSWHMSLTQWFRAYFFNPLVRSFRTNFKWVPAVVVMTLAQFSTMILIGLWHGVTWNYVLWGAWHALGLFIHARWSEWLRGRSTAPADSPLRRSLFNACGVVLTFHYVALGWVFFALTTPAQSWAFILQLFGVS